MYDLDLFFEFAEKAFILAWPTYLGPCLRIPLSRAKMVTVSYDVMGVRAESVKSQDNKYQSRSAT